MAKQAKMTIRIAQTRAATTLQFSTTGTYGRLTTGGLQITLPGQALLPTATLEAFWLAALAVVQAELTALEA